MKLNSLIFSLLTGLVLSNPTQAQTEPLPPVQSITRIERPAVTVIRNKFEDKTFDVQLVEKEIRTDISFVDELVQVPYYVQVPYQVIVTRYRVEYRCYPYPFTCRYENVPYQVWETHYRNEVRYRQEWRRREVRTETIVRADSIPVRLELSSATILANYEREEFTLAFTGPLNDPTVTIGDRSITQDYVITAQLWADQIFTVMAQGTPATTIEDLSNEDNVLNLTVKGENQNAALEFTDQSIVRGGVTSTHYDIKLYGKKRGKLRLMGTLTVNRNQVAQAGNKIRIPLSTLHGLSSREFRRFLDSNDSIKVVLNVTRTSPLWSTSGGILASFTKTHLGKVD